MDLWQLQFRCDGSLYVTFLYARKCNKILWVSIKRISFVTIWGKPFELLIESVVLPIQTLDIRCVASFFHCDTGWARSVPDENMTMQNTATVHLICHDDALSPNLYNGKTKYTASVNTKKAIVK